MILKKPFGPKFNNLTGSMLKRSFVGKSEEHEEGGILREKNKRREEMEKTFKKLGLKVDHLPNSDDLSNYLDLDTNI